MRSRVVTSLTDNIASPKRAGLGITAGAPTLSVDLSLENESFAVSSKCPSITGTHELGIADEGPKEDELGSLQVNGFEHTATVETPVEIFHNAIDIPLFRKAISRHAGANAALDELCQQGVDVEQFLGVLEFSVTVLMPPEKPRRQPDWEIPGMPPRRLLKMAERLERMAGELEMVDAHDFIKGTYGMVPTEWENKFRELPNLLRDRAFALKVQVPANRAIHVMILREIRKRAKLNLIEYIRNSTEKNRPRYEEVALLLNAALFEVGSDEVVTAESLRTLWHDDQFRTKSLENPTE